MMTLRVNHVCSGANHSYIDQQKNFHKSMKIFQNVLNPNNEQLINVKVSLNIGT